MSDLKQYHPELVPRKGERTAWALTLLMTLGLFLLKHEWGSIPASAWIFWAFLLFSAFSISLGNWMDRQTVLTLSEEGLSFVNGVRRVHFRWDEIQRVRVFPARWGKTVQVLAADSHFDFHTLGEVSYQGKEVGRMGFAEGEQILAEIVDAAQLTLKREENGSYEYARE